MKSVEEQVREELMKVKKDLAILEREANRIITILDGISRILDDIASGK